MPEAWRIVKAKHAATAFTGDGAAKTGGRWNSRGVSMVYASATKSLAALETLVHLNPPVVFRYKVFQLEFEAKLVETLPGTKLPLDWQAEPPSRTTQALGDAWVREARSAVLAVPSVIVPDELNYVLNPFHPDFGAIRIREPEDFTIDPRLLR